MGPVPGGRTLIKFNDSSTAFNAEAGLRPGWDLAGIVEQQAADGSGPRTDSRVVGMLRSGTWAEVVAVPTIIMLMPYLSLVPLQPLVQYPDLASRPTYQEEGQATAPLHAQRAAIACEQLSP